MLSKGNRILKKLTQSIIKRNSFKKPVSVIQQNLNRHDEVKQFDKQTSFIPFSTQSALLSKFSKPLLFSNQAMHFRNKRNFMSLPNAIDLQKNMSPPVPKKVIRLEIDGVNEKCKLVFHDKSMQFNFNKDITLNNILPGAEFVNLVDDKTARKSIFYGLISPQEMSHKPLLAVWSTGKVIRFENDYFFCNIHFHSETYNFTDSCNRLGRFFHNENSDLVIEADFDDNRIEIEKSLANKLRVLHKDLVNNNKLPLKLSLHLNKYIYEDVKENSLAIAQVKKFIKCIHEMLLSLPATHPLCLNALNLADFDDNNFTYVIKRFLIPIEARYDDVPRPSAGDTGYGGLLCDKGYFPTEDARKEFFKLLLITATLLHPQIVPVYGDYAVSHFYTSVLHVLPKLPNQTEYYKYRHHFIFCSETSELFYVNHSKNDFEKVKINDIDLFKKNLKKIIGDSNTREIRLTQNQFNQLILSNGGFNKGQNMGIVYPSTLTQRAVAYRYGLDHYRSLIFNPIVICVLESVDLLYTAKSSFGTDSLLDELYSTIIYNHINDYQAALWLSGNTNLRFFVNKEESSDHIPFKYKNFYHAPTMHSGKLPDLREGWSINKFNANNVNLPKHTRLFSTQKNSGAPQYSRKEVSCKDHNITNANSLPFRSEISFIIPVTTIKVSEFCRQPEPHCRHYISNQIHSFISSKLENFDQIDYYYLTEIIANAFDAYAMRGLKLGEEFIIKVVVQEKNDKIIIKIKNNGEEFKNIQKSKLFHLSEIGYSNKSEVPGMLGGHKRGMIAVENAVDIAGGKLLFKNRKHRGVSLYMEFDNNQNSEILGKTIRFKK